jgi:hypothetical protein
MALTQWHAENLDDKSFFFAALRNSVGETLFFTIVGFLLFVLSYYFWWLAVVLCVPLSILSLISLVQSLVLLPSAISTWTTVRFLLNHATNEERAGLIGDQTLSNQSYALGTALVGAFKGIVIVLVYIFIWIRLLQ